MSDGDKLVTQDGLKGVYQHIDGRVTALKGVADRLWYDRPLTLTNRSKNRINGSGGISANANFYCWKAEDIAAGDEVTVKATWPATSSTSNSGVLIAFYDANDTVLLKGATHTKSQEGTAFTETLTVPEGTSYVRVAGGLNYDFSATKRDVYVPAYIQADIAKTDEARAYAILNAGHDVLSAFSNIMCCGDSLTASVVYTGESEGENVTRAAYQRYPEILAAKTGASVTHRALGGCNAKEWWDSFHNYIVQQENQLAIIYLGTNVGEGETAGLTDTVDTDAVGDDPASYTENNTGSYCKIIRTFQQLGARVLLVHICERVNGYQAVNTAMDHIAERFGCAVVDVPYLAGSAYHKWPDGTGSNALHYNDLGYAAWTESLIRNVGALPDEMLQRIIPI